jgi:threonine dehydrogenase-like Zn-dependent dehydrogenase
MTKQKYPHLVKVATYEGPRKLKIRHVVKPRIVSTQVLLMVHAASVCGTDLRIFRGETMVEPGRVLGHDFSGTVIETGQKVHKVSKGDNVAVSPVGHCGRCEFCLVGLDTMCVDGRWHGFEKDGGFAQFVAVDERNVLKLPNEVSLDQAAILEPFVVAMRCFDRAPVQRGDWICAFGQGAIGLAVTAVARSLGYQVVAIEPDRRRHAISRRLGVAACFPAVSPPILEKIAKLTKHKGIALSIEASGSQLAVDWSREVLRPNGTVVLAGSGINLRGPLINTGGKELSYLEVELGPLRLYRKAIRFIAQGRIDPLVLNPLQISLDQLPQVMKQQSQKILPVVKVLVYPNKSCPSK